MKQILEPLSFPLQGTRLIEASAGTGKTYTIAALYLRLVLGHGGENGFSPEGSGELSQEPACGNSEAYSGDLSRECAGEISENYSGDFSEGLSKEPSQEFSQESEPGCFQYDPQELLGEPSREAGHMNSRKCCRELTPPEILVVTFTNAATEELRDRIRTRLTEAASFFRGQGEGDDYLKDLRDDYLENELMGKARLLDEAAQWMDESAVYTIHGWCQRMLRQHAFDSGSLFDLELTANDRELLEEAANDYWRCRFYPLPVEILTELMEEIGLKTPLDLLAGVRPLLSMAEKDPVDPFHVMDLRRQAIEDARGIWEKDFASATGGVQAAQADKTLNGNKYRKASLAKWMDRLTSWVKENGPLPEKQVLEKFSKEGLEYGVAKNKVAPAHPAYDAMDRLREQLSELKVDTALFNHAAREIYERFRKEKQRLAMMGFDDLLTLLNDALHRPGNERLSEVIRKQFPVALIDEFQDTDPIQYAAFNKIYGGRGDTGLFMIGDPKQAIYAFRGADIHTYLSARKRTREHGREPYTLKKNYRSTQGMVTSVNRMFEWAEKHDEGAFLFKEEIPFDEVGALGKKEQLIVDNEPQAAMNLWRLEQDEPIKKTGEGGYLSLMAESTAGEIVRLLNLGEGESPKTGFLESGKDLRPLGPSDIAILVRDGREARAIRDAMDARGVRSVYLSDKDSVFDSSEARSLLYLLRAAREPSEERALKAALATEILNLPLSRLDHLNRDELAWEAEVERFRGYRRIWQRQGVLPMLRTLFREFEVPTRLLSLSSGERVLTNVLHLAEMLQAAAGTLDGESGLIRWLAEQIREPGKASDEQILRLESDEKLIQVVTIHKSKGLEYPLVFLPFICSFRQVTARNSKVVKYHDEDGNPKLKQNPGADDLAEADRERLAEDLRMLYVALTRAKYACWLGIGVMGKITKKKGEESDLHRSGLGYLLSGGEMISTGELEGVLAEVKGSCEHISVGPLPPALPDFYRPTEPETVLEPACEFEGEVPRDWRITSYSGILAGAGMDRAGVSPEGVTETEPPEFGGPWPEGLGAEEEGAVPDFPDSATEDQLLETETEPYAAPEIKAFARSIHNFPKGPEPGTFLHGLLEWAAREGFSALARDRERIHEWLTAHCERRGWEPWVEVLTDWMLNLLQTQLPLPEDGGEMALADLGAGNYQSELEFLFAAHGVDARVLDDAVITAVMPERIRPRLRENTVNGMLKGFMDLVFCHQDRYYVVDYKSNFLGEDEGAYVEEVMAEGMLEHRYDLQYVLYTLALHRLLKARLPGYDYRRDVGGVMYLFLRGIDAPGNGVYVDKPSQELIERLDDYFSGREEFDAA